MVRMTTNGHLWCLHSSSEETTQIGHAREAIESLVAAELDGSKVRVLALTTNMRVYKFMVRRAKRLSQMLESRTRNWVAIFFAASAS